MSKTMLRVGAANVVGALIISILLLAGLVGLYWYRSYRSKQVDSSTPAVRVVSAAEDKKDEAKPSLALQENDTEIDKEKKEFIETVTSKESKKFEESDNIEEFDEVSESKEIDKDEEDELGGADEFEEFDEDEKVDELDDETREKIRAEVARHVAKVPIGEIEEE